MKSLILCALAALSANAAFANVTCDYVRQIPGGGNTEVIIENGTVKSTNVIVTHSRPIPNYHPVQETFSVDVSHIGPEVVEYSNKDKGFLLEVGYQPMNGKIYGTLTEELDGRRVQSSVICHE